MLQNCLLKGLPWWSWVNNSPTSVGDMGSIPGLGGSHKLWCTTTEAHTPQNPCSTTREATPVRSPCSEIREQPPLTNQREPACSSKGLLQFSSPQNKVFNKLLTQDMIGKLRSHDHVLCISFFRSVPLDLACY